MAKTRAQREHLSRLRAHGLSVRHVIYLRRVLCYVELALHFSSESLRLVVLDHPRLWPARIVMELTSLRQVFLNNARRVAMAENQIMVLREYIRVGFVSGLPNPGDVHNWRRAVQFLRLERSRYVGLTQAASARANLISDARCTF